MPLFCSVLLAIPAWCYCPSTLLRLRRKHSCDPTAVIPRSPRRHSCEGRNPSRSRANAGVLQRTIRNSLTF